MTSDRLTVLYPESEAQALVHWLMEDLLDLTRVQIALGAVVTDDLADFEQAVSRLMTGEPIQYVLGYAWFRERKFEVGPGVLIPRSETELAVDAVLAALKGGMSVIDIGTGSGCIAVSVARERPDVRMTAWDISSAALELTERNAALGDVMLHVQKVDVLLAWPNIEADIIVSNPPYVLQSEKALMHQNVLDYEPAEALFVSDDDPLKYYRAIAKGGGDVLGPGGKLIVEINERFSAETAMLFDQLGYQDVEVRRDINGKDRLVIGTK